MCFAVKICLCNYSKNPFHRTPRPHLPLLHRRYCALHCVWPSTVRTWLDTQTREEQLRLFSEISSSLSASFMKMIDVTTHLNVDGCVEYIGHNLQDGFVGRSSTSCQDSCVLAEVKAHVGCNGFSVQHLSFDQGAYFYLRRREPIKVSITNFLTCNVELSYLATPFAEEVDTEVLLLFQRSVPTTFGIISLEVKCSAEKEWPLPC